jgi:O-6-methylguanine DNA methyltransferase
MKSSFNFRIRKPFSARVLAVVRKIPRGNTLSYREVARRAGRAGAARAVGNIMNKNRDPKVPCHRVIRSDGSPGGYAWGAAKKIKILKKEVAL